jgi:hypothetical protein
MKWSGLQRPSPALVISLIALFVALGGTGYAAIKLPKNSVGTKQLKKNAVTSAKVKNGSLRSSDFKRGQIPAGPQGPQGAQGVPGPVDVTFVRSKDVVAVHGTQQFVEADCPAGTVPSGGGVSNSGATDVSVNGSFPNHAAGTSTEVPNAWGALVNNNDPNDQIVVAYAICVSATHVSSIVTR